MKRKALLVVAFLSLWTPPLAGQLTERLYQEACDGGGMLECLILGILYQTGDGVTQEDYHERPADTCFPEQAFGRRFRRGYPWAI